MVLWWKSDNILETCVRNCTESLTRVLLLTFVEEEVSSFDFIRTSSSSSSLK
jgi:hypothetical protein